MYLHLFGKKPEVEICRKWICMICLIDMSWSSMLEMVQEAETPYPTLYMFYIPY